ncbi:zinc finger protein 613-like [Anopheles bellator]|uniref:zinc finger protein 613-like n=1 Tax=Anopheles bellator TaxID=139047 RepID=UPI002648B983|nr:zinc finger protein 613-like [Anopheles bellator]
MESTVCLLCLKHKEPLKVSSTAFETDVINTITLHFWFTNEIAQKHFVCNDCWKQVDEFDKFYKEVELIHETRYCIEVSVECPKSSTNVQEVYWDDGSDADDIDEKIERIFDVVQEQHQKKSCVDDLPEKDDMDSFDAKQNGTCNEVHQGTMLKEFVSIDVSDALDEGHFYPKHSFGLSDIEDEPSDTEIGISLDTHDKILSKQCETPALTPVPENTSYKCQSCDTIFVKEYQLNAHEQFCKRYTCIDCELVYSNLKEFISHRKHHKPTKRNNPEQDGESYQCTDCSKCFPTEVAVDRHIANVHYAPKLFICDVCSKSFRQKKNYDYHKRVIHLKQYTPVECDICKKWLKDACYLREHKAKCHSIKKCVCSTCGKEFLKTANLKNHITRVHNANKLLCSICGKSLSSKNNLKEHMFSHTGDYLYTCPYCPKQFNSHSNMTTHRKKKHPLEFQKAYDQYKNRYKPLQTIEVGEHTDS